MGSTDRLMIVDGNNITYRAFHATVQARLTDSKGRPTGGLFLATKMFLTYLRELKPTHCVWFFDHGKSDMRLALRDTYKGHRKTASVETHAEVGSGPFDPSVAIPQQIEALRELLSLAGVAHVSNRGVEADDLIAHTILTKRWPERVNDTVVVTSDHDMFQLVCDDPTVMVFRPGTDKAQSRSGVGLGGMTAPTSGRLYDIVEVVEKYGLPPDQLVDMFALTGDSSDNIKGIKGVGPVTATKWVRKHGDLSRVLAFEPKCEGWEKHCSVNRQLMLLDGSIGTVPLSLAECKLGEELARGELPEAVRPLCEAYEMTSLAKEIA